MRRVLYIGFLLSSNIGDYILSCSIIRQLKNNGMHVICADLIRGCVVDEPQLLQREPSIQHIHAPLRKRIFRNVRVRLKRYCDTAERTLMNRLRAEYDTLYIGGGNMLMDNNELPYFTLKVWKYVRAACANKKSVHMILTGVGPLRTAEQVKYVKKTLCHCDKISVRDSLSYDIARQFVDREICVLPDPAFLYPCQTTLKYLAPTYICLNIFSGGGI